MSQARNDSLSDFARLSPFSRVSDSPLYATASWVSVTPEGPSGMDGTGAPFTVWPVVCALQNHEDVSTVTGASSALAGSDPMGKIAPTAKAVVRTRYAVRTGASGWRGDESYPLRRA